MSRLPQLQARRRALLRQCEVQRAELSVRVAQLRASPLSRAAHELLTREGDAGALPLLRPLTWAAALAGLLLLRRPSQVLMLLGWARTAVALGSRAAVALRMLDQLRAHRRARGNESASP